jgi:hypothetical protein
MTKIIDAPGDARDSLSSRGLLEDAGFLAEQADELPGRVL